MRYRFPSGVVVAASAVMSLQCGTLRARERGSGNSEYALIPAPNWDFFFPGMIETSEMARSKKTRNHDGFSFRVTFHGPFGEYARVYLLSNSERDADGQMSWIITQINFCDGPLPIEQWQRVIPEKAQVLTFQLVKA